MVTAPDGLCGELSRIARVRGVIAPATSSTRRWKPSSGRNGTYTAGPGRREHARVGRVGRLAEDHLVALLDEAEHGREERRLRAGEEHDPIRRDLAARLPRGAPRNRLERRRLTSGIRVARASRPQGADRRLDDRLGRREVRLPEAEHDHVVPGGGALAGQPVDVPAPAGHLLDAAGERGEATCGGTV